MGCGASSVQQEAVIVSNNINKRLKEDDEISRKDVKLLLLGAGESGKSTIAKQLRIIHGNGYTQEECKKYRSIIHSNTLQSLFSIIHAMKELKLEFHDLCRHNDIKLLFEMTRNSINREITKELADIIARIWKDNGIQACFLRSREYQLNDSAGYFLDKIGTISEFHYVPTQQDVLKTHVQTIGIVETHFVYN